MEIKVYATLRDIVGGPVVHFDTGSPITVDGLLQDLCDQYPGMRPKLLYKKDWHPGAHILINGRDMRYLDGLETTVSPTDEVRIFPPVGGGVR